MAAQNGKTYDFGDFRLIPGEGLLLRNGEPVSLSLKAFASLVVLVERHGHLVQRSELIETVWENAFVEDANISKCVWAIRNALGEDSKSSRFIQTIPRRGYRFVAPVSTLNDSSGAFRLPLLPDVEEIDQKDVFSRTLGNGNGKGDRSAAKVAEVVTFRTEGTVETAVVSDDLATKPPSEGERSRPGLRRWVPYAGFAAVLLGGISLYLVFSGASILGKGDTSRIAVLPLKPLDLQTRDAIYDLGITEALILKLSGAKKLSVRPLNAIRGYVDVNDDPIKAGKEQGVDYVLASNYQIANGRIKVTSQLIDIATGRVEDKATVEKDTANFFSAQDAIANEIGDRILAKFGSVSTQFRVKHGTDNEEAYRNYQHAMTLIDQQRPGSVLKANEYLDRAVELDPNYAQAWAGKANANSVGWNANRSSNNEKLYQASMEAATRALAIDPNLSDAHVSLCDSRFFYELNFDGAETACKRATELDPNSSLAHMTYTMLLVSRGRFDEAFVEIKTAMDLDPVSLRNQRIFANQLYTARRYDEAIEVYRRLVDLNPDVGMTYLWFIRALEHSEHKSEAFENLIRLLTLQNRDHETIERFKTAYASSGWAGVIKERIETELREERPNYAHLAEYYGKLGDKDKAFECLETSFRKRAWLMMYLRVDPRFDPLRDDPRFDDLVGRVEGK